MNIIIKNKEAIAKMRIAGKLAADVLEMIEPYVLSGVSTEEIDRICHDYIINVQNAIPAPLDYHGFPKSICTSVNHVICHGIPSDKKLKSGDILNIDITVIKDGYHGDTSKMFIVGGKTSILASRLCAVTLDCLKAGIEQVKPGNHFIDIGRAIEKIAHKNNFSVVEVFCGHGIGAGFHESPQILHYVSKKEQERSKQMHIMKPGMIFTIEPMINAGKKDVTIIKDKKYKHNDIHPAITKDRTLSAQWEHTILVTETGHEVLTLRKEEI